MAGPASLTYKSSLDALMASENIAASMSETDRGNLGSWAHRGYLADKSSRAGWEQKMATVMKLALQVAETKSFPWPNCSNIKFPLITVAALNFHSRAYPSLVPVSGVVYCGPMGYSPAQDLIDRAARIAGHMSYQVQRCTEWESETDKALLVVPIIGCAFKKVEYDPVRRTRQSRLVMPENLIVDYFTTDLRSSPRISEYFTLTRNEVRENVLAGQWLDVDNVLVTPPSGGPLEAARDQRQGVTPSGQESEGSTLHFIEQHCYLDLDGDGYDEPYIVTFDRDTGRVRCLQARYLPSCIERRKVGSREVVLRIEPVKFYVKLPFIPSPDGGFYDLGFGHLLGPLNEAADSLINQLVDAGTMSNLGGGFLGRGMRIKKGTSTFVPHEWKTVESVGDDISKNIFALPVRDPSQTLLSLVTFLIGYAERIASANEVQMGEVPAHNVKAGAMAIADQNGARIYAAIFKRLWRAIGEEFQLFYDLNKNFPITLDYEQSGKWYQLTEDDYRGSGITLRCSADPDAVTDLQRQTQAALIFQTAQAVPGHNLAAATKRLYRAHNVPDIQEIFPVNEIPQPPNVQLLAAQTKQFEAETKRMAVQSNMMEARSTLQLEAELASAKILNLYAQAELFAKEADAVTAGQQIAAVNAEIGALKHQRDGVLKLLDILKDHIFPQNGESTNGIKLAAAGSGARGVSPTGPGEISPSPSLPSLVGTAGNGALPELGVRSLQ